MFLTGSLSATSPSFTGPLLQSRWWSDAEAGTERGVRPISSHPSLLQGHKVDRRRSEGTNYLTYGGVPRNRHHPSLDH